MLARTACGYPDLDQAHGSRVRLACGLCAARRRRAPSRWKHESPIPACAADLAVGLLAAVRADPGQDGCRSRRARNACHGRPLARRHGPHSPVSRCAGQLGAGHMGAEQAVEMAGNVEKDVNFLIANCRLDPDADAALHGIIAKLLKGAHALKSNPADLAAIAPMREAMAEYAASFDDPAFRTQPASP